MPAPSKMGILCLAPVICGRDTMQEDNTRFVISKKNDKCLYKIS